MKENGKGQVIYRSLHLAFAVAVTAPGAVRAEQAALPSPAPSSASLPAGASADPSGPTAPAELGASGTPASTPETLSNTVAPDIEEKWKARAEAIVNDCQNLKAVEESVKSELSSSYADRDFRRYAAGVRRRKEAMARLTELKHGVQEAVNQMVAEGVARSTVEQMRPALKKQCGQEITIAQTEAFDLPRGASPMLGVADAPLRVVVFADLECPYCARTFPLFRSLLENPKYRGRVSVTFKHLPISNHKFARPAALMSLAVQELGGDKAFWRFAELVYKNQSGLSRGNLILRAGEAGVDGDAAAGLAVSNGETSYQKRLDEDASLSTQSFVRGTPTIFVNGWELKLRSIEAIERLVSEKHLLEDAPDVGAPR